MPVGPPDQTLSTLSRSVCAVLSLSQPGLLCEPRTAGEKDRQAEPLPSEAPAGPVSAASAEGRPFPPCSRVPGGLVKEHDRGIVHQLQRDGQALPLAPGEAPCPRVGT